MNRKIKRLPVLALISVLTAALALSGCSSDETASGTGDNKRGHFTATLYDRGNVPPEAGTIDNNRWTKWINEEGPVDVKFVPFPRAEQVQKLNLLFASGEAPD